MGCEKERNVHHAKEGKTVIAKHCTTVRNAVKALRRSFKVNVTEHIRAKNEGGSATPG